MDNDGGFRLDKFKEVKSELEEHLNELKVKISQNLQNQSESI